MATVYSDALRETRAGSGDVMARMKSRRTFLADISRVAAASALAGGIGGTASAQGTGQATEAALKELADSFKANAWGQIVRPGGAGYNKITYYNARFDCLKRTTFLRPANAEGVRDIVTWANRHGRTLAIRGGGHSFEGKSSHPDLVIDMSHLTKHTFKDGVLEVQAGVVLGDVYKTLSPKGFVLPAGTCPTVGIVGHTLGGGIGDFLPMFGYAAQSLTAATLVTMGGSILDVSEDDITVRGDGDVPARDLKGPDLLRLMRGGGQGTFGVVTSMTFKAHDVRQAKLGNFKIAATSPVSAVRAIAILKAWQDWRVGSPESMQSLVSAKLNLSRDGSGYGIDIAGLIVIPADAKTTMAEIRKSLAVLFQMPDLQRKTFKDNISVPAAIQSFLDTDETTRNPKRRFLYGSSSSMERALPLPALTFLIQTLSAPIFASLYTSGGNSKKGVATSLHPSEFLIEWSTYSPRRNATAHRDIRALNAEMMKRAGFDDHAFPNYPDADARDYSPDKERISMLRAQFDPKTISTSSLFGDRPAGWPESTCR